MVVTDHEEWYWNAKRFADRGKPFNSEIRSNLFLGLNYRMTELDAVIGRVQLEKMMGIAEARRAFVRRLEEEIADLETVRVAWYPRDSEPAWWFLLIRIYPEKLKVDKARFAAAVAAEGIPMGARLQPVPAWEDISTLPQPDIITLPRHCRPQPLDARARARLYSHYNRMSLNRP